MNRHPEKPRLGIRGGDRFFMVFNLGFKIQLLSATVRINQTTTLVFGGLRQVGYIADHIKYSHGIHVGILLQKFCLSQGELSMFGVRNKSFLCSGCPV